MLFKLIPVGSFACNCYLMADDDGKAAVIDPGDEAERILDIVKESGVTVETILQTHCHLDHITGTRGVHEGTGAKILIHAADRPLYDNLSGQRERLLGMFGMEVDPVDDPVPPHGTFDEGDEIAVGALRFAVLHTPGHTPGSCAFTTVAEKRTIVFCGDTLFAGSIGRTDLPGGDSDREIESIRTKLYKLPDETLVYPGHGPPTTIGTEKTDNPFVSDQI